MKKALIALAALLLAVALLWRPWQEKPAPAPGNSVHGNSLPEPVREMPRTPATSPIPDTLTAVPQVEIQRVLDAIDNLGFTFRDHATALGGNPVGTNAEITAALLGDNAKQLRLAIPEGSTVNSQGELCDPWGTPWFFHQLSGTRMEIRSAGLDRTLHTADDFVR